jgi:Putative phage abortive infection protein
MTKRAKAGESTPDMQTMLGQLIPGVYVVGAVVLVFYALYFWGTGISGDPSDWGTLGDYFGGLMNPVVSFATLIVAYAVWKQQRDELRDTKKALEDQAKTAEQQRQEQRFFDLLHVYYRTVESLRIEMRFGGIHAYQGKEAIQRWLAESAKELGDLNQNFGDYTGSDFEKGVLQSSWRENQGTERFGAYLRTIEAILTTAKELFRKSQHQYIELFKAQLSNSELALIGCFLFLEDQEALRLRELSEQYGLFSHLIASDLLSILKDQLSVGAFAAMPNRNTDLS